MSGNKLTGTIPSSMCLLSLSTCNFGGQRVGSSPSSSAIRGTIGGAGAGAGSGLLAGIRGGDYADYADGDDGEDEEGWDCSGLLTSCAMQLVKCNVGNRCLSTSRPLTPAMFYLVVALVALVAVGAAVGAAVVVLQRRARSQLKQSIKLRRAATVELLHAFVLGDSDGEFDDGTETGGSFILPPESVEFAQRTLCIAFGTGGSVCVRAFGRAFRVLPFCVSRTSK